MKRTNTSIRNFVLCLLVAVLFSCQQAGINSTGSEFMPDMGHSIAYEANYYNYYYNNTWGSQDDYHKFAQPGLPVAGTIPRGYAGGHDLSRIYGRTSNNAVPHSPNGAVPYYYGNTEEERTRATNEIIENPYQITDEGLARGEVLYDVYCGICHGENGDGLGYIAREDGGKYPAQPANLLLEDFVTSSNGRLYHAIMYGKNLMGGYSDKLSYEERWQVVHYMRSLQAKDLELAYNQYENTLNGVDVPAGDIVTKEEAEEEHSEGGEHETDGDGEHHTDHEESDSNH